MRKAISITTVLCMLLAVFLPLKAQAVTTNAPSRVINLVYDDSSSMIETNGECL